LAARKNYSILAGVIVLLFVAACGYISGMTRGPGTEKIDEISYRLKFVAAKAESELRYADTSEISEEKLLALIKKDSRVYDAFKDLYLGFSIQGRHVAALVCDKERSNMIAEDSQCTDAVDRTMNTQGKMPCDFTLNLAQLCANK
jgi:hypothetical protein